MKLGISLPDDVFRDVNRAAKRLGISRSELLAKAATQFLGELKSGDVTASYDRAFGPPAKAASERKTEAFRRAAARRALLDVEW